jgi:hypothetical protein
MAHRAERIAFACLASTFATGLAACGDPSQATGTETSPTSTSVTTTITTDPITGTSTGTTDAETTDEPTAGTTTTTTTPPTSTTTTTDPTSTDTDTSTTSPPCIGLECQIDQCNGNPDMTTLSGIVYAPEGTLPLYNITVYVPGGPLEPVVEGVTCDTCGDGLPGDPIIAGLTNTKGEFKLTGVPSGQNIPLVVSVGKWRREVVLPEVVPCADNIAPYDLTRLPRNQSEGHIPKIALVTGGADPLECLLRKIGLEDSEFTPEAGDGRVNLYEGDGGADQYDDSLNSGANFTGAGTLWGSLDNYKKYDMVLMACEGAQNGGDKSGAMRQNLVDYAGLGGRIFLSHWHNIWIEGGPDPWPSTADFVSEPDLPNPVTAKIDTSFPKGQALADWMINVGGSMVPGEMQIKEAQYTVDSVNEMTSTRWVYTDSPEDTVQCFTFNAPVGAPAEQQCGRVVDSDIHVSSGDSIGEPFPNGCETEGLSPQEKALVFMFFELSACLIPDDEDPIPG